MNSLIWKGVSSTTIKGLLICELPPITKPQMRISETVIDGRDGSTFEELGYSSYDKAVQIGLYGDYDIDKVIKYFTGEGDIIFSNEPTKFYSAKICSQIDYNRLLRYRQATVVFRVQPFKHKYNEAIRETPSATASGTSIVVSDCEEAHLKAFKIYGKSTQNGTPTPDTPIDIVSVGDDGNVSVNMFGKNLLQITKSEIGASIVNNGITFTYDADGGVAMNGTATSTAFYNMDYENGDVKYPTQTKLIASVDGIIDGITMVIGYFDSEGVAVDSVANVRVATPSVEYQLPAGAKRGRNYLMVAQGTTLKNVVVYPMIRLETSHISIFEPYKAAQSLSIESQNGLKAIPVTDKSLATYTDADGKMWYADEIDLDRGVYIQRCFAEAIPMTLQKENNRYTGKTSKVANTKIGTTNGIIVLCDSLQYHGDAGLVGTQTNGVRISSYEGETVVAYYNGQTIPTLNLVYPLATPIETPLTDEQIAICKSLKANNPTTTILNDENAYMMVEYIKPFEVMNEGLEPSKPIMTLNGSGTVEISVNGLGVFSYTFPDGENEVVIDSEKQDAYLNDVLKNRNMNGEFPILQPKTNRIRWSGDVKNIKVFPRSRWL